MRNGGAWQAEAHPPIGAYLRPVPELCYCYRVVGVWLPDENDQRTVLSLERWGWRDGQPCDDGHVSKGHSLSDLRNVLPGVWKDEWDCDTPRWTCCPLYYRQVTLRGQQDMFL